MAHVLIIRGGSSFVCHPDAVLGAHEQTEESINNRKYSINNIRKGYTTPFNSEWKFLDYRIKEEIIPKFVNDLCCHNLNPVPNNITLWNIFKKKKTSSKDYSVNRLFAIIQWVFKYVNKKKYTTLFFIGLTLLGISSILLSGVIIALLWINPIKPVPVSKDDKNRFFSQWNMNFTIGYLKDPTRTYKMGDETVVVKDVL